MSHYSSKHYKASDAFDKFYFDLFFTKGNDMLDIGCSTGNLISQDPKKIIGIDSDEDSLKVARNRGFKVVKHDVSKKFPFGSNSFQTIHSRHVLEHLENPLPFMKEVFRILKKNGRLVLMTDKHSAHFYDDYTHKKPFTKHSLEQLLHDSGFSKFEIYDFPSQGVPGIGFLYKKGLIGSKAALKVYKSYAKIKSHSLVIEAFK